MGVRCQRGIKERFQAHLIGKRERILNALLNGLDQLAGTTGGRSGSRAQGWSEGPGLRTRIAMVGCGFVADSYVRMLPLHPELELIGVMDRDGLRATRFASSHRIKAYPSLQALLDDPQVEVVVNLTNPDSHFAVSRASLEAGKHVYSEKPLAMVLSEAEALVALAEARGLLLAAAPCSILGESAQTLGKALRRREIGKVRVAYAEIDDGPIHQMHPEAWASPSGIPWPWKDEFTVGCTMEHAGYYLTWLVAFFGPARSVTAFSSCLIPDKHPELPPEASAPDFSVACIRFHSGVVARLTCSIVAPHDHSLRIIGDRGVLSVDECWHHGAPVRLRPFTALGLRAETFSWLARHWLTRALYGLDGRCYGPTPRPAWRCRLRRHKMDYARGIAELAAALREGRSCRLSARFALHVNEIALAIQHGHETGSSTTIRSTCPPLELYFDPT